MRCFPSARVDRHDNVFVIFTAMKYHEEDLLNEYNALLWTGKNYTEIKSFIGDDGDISSNNAKDTNFYIRTNSQDLICPKGCYILKNDNELYIVYTNEEYKALLTLKTNQNEDNKNVLY